ncbi:High-affinity methionine permease protein [Rutstroemia sp. NJR-2017a BBW]|nr:High-affinity methionine permease protein [Rutstroemia sp. NJR-2017a BBW]
MAEPIMMSQLGPKNEIEPTGGNSLHRTRTNISLGEVSVEDLQYDNEEQAAGNPAKEYTKAPKDTDLLNRFQVFCIIANRMMGTSSLDRPLVCCKSITDKPTGTGIFETPTSVIQQDRNVGGSIFLWVVGCIASMAGTLMYVEYGLTIPRRRMNGEIQAVPRSGGELNYLKFLAKYPKFLAICIFGFIFVVVGNSAANCVSFGVHVLAASGNHNPKKGVVQAIALATAWLVTLLHALGRMAGIHLNSVFAVTKVSMLIMIIILGFIVLNNHTSLHRDPLSYSNLDTKTSFKHLGRVDNARGFATSYLNIVFTFGGWNQANYFSTLLIVRLFSSVSEYPPQFSNLLTFAGTRRDQKAHH